MDPLKTAWGQIENRLKRGDAAIELLRKLLYASGIRYQDDRHVALFIVADDSAPTLGEIRKIVSKNPFSLGE